MKRLNYVFATLFAMLLLTFTSCEKSDDPVTEPVAELGEVSFDVENFITGAQAKGGIDKLSVTCTDLEADFVFVTINDGTADMSFELDLITLQTNDGKMQTEVLKLTPGVYTIKEFAVYNGTANNNDDTDDTVLFASPDAASVYVTSWGMIGVGGTFTVEAFQKAPVDIHVLCYVPSDYEDFGFSWFQFKKFKAKKIYFFGDVCSKFWEEWRDANGSPYAGTINGYDFVAGFKVDLYLGTPSGTNPAKVTEMYDPANPPLKDDGVTIAPLCIEYVDNLNSIAETYTFVISLLLPDNTYSEIHTGTFTDANWSADPVVINTDGTTDNFGGIDGIFDFVVGNCSYVGNDANVELPAWIPLPSTTRFKVNGLWSNNAYLGIVFDFDLDNDANAATTATSTIGEWTEGSVYGVFCGNKIDQISTNTWYTATVHSSLNPSTMHADYAAYPWGKLNWLANHRTGFTAQQYQDALWWIIHNQTRGAAVTGLTNLADANYVPTVGDYAFAVLDGNNPGRDIQLMVVRVDP